ncbi:cytochrome c-type biogenesis protein CcmE [Deinobacterium chartae]|uniref:Cytochrome c-type biogenesis protein CcmE n=1 Tax=Deinobacterium chartae TaxID=521158 RepID=A0A841I2N6_9DEIO|nr:cytochrome c-type biogenesis protein CcmE [Deinobacterium chartae]
MTTLPAAKRRRKGSAAKYLIGLGVLIAAVAYLIYGNLNSNLVFFVTPSEYKIDAARYAGRTLRLGGVVKPGSEQYDRATLELRFLISDGSTDIPVQYRGAVPDLFRPGQGVVVEGKMQGETFMGENLLVKHSEEYKAPQPGDQVDYKKLLEDTR